MRPFETFESSYVHLAADDVDTDQIVPARFLKVTDRDGLEAALFADWRARETAAGRTFVIDTPAAAGARVLLGGRNFGCGSSREHAVWALSTRFDAVIAPSFADIFRSNAYENGLLPIAVDRDAHALLVTHASEQNARVRIDLEACTVTLPDGSTTRFTIEPFARRCMLDGTDRLGALLREQSAYDAWQAASAAFVATLHPAVAGGAS